MWPEGTFWKELDSYRMEASLAGEKQIVFK